MYSPMYDEMNESFKIAYSAILDRLPVSVWVEDWSPVKVMIDALAREGMVDWRGHFERRLDMAIEAANAIDVIDVNEATLALYRAKCKADVIASTRGEKMSSGEMDAFREQLIAFAEGEFRFTIDAEELTMDDAEIQTRIFSEIVPEHRDDWPVVYCIIEEISKREQTAAAEPADHPNDELVYWQAIKDSRNSEDYEAYLEVFPEGLFAPLARRRSRRNGGTAMPCKAPPAPLAAKIGLDFDRLDQWAKKNTKQARSRAAEP